MSLPVWRHDTPTRGLLGEGMLAAVRKPLTVIPPDALVDCVRVCLMGHNVLVWRIYVT